VSVQTTERYLGCKQRIRNAVNDRIGTQPKRTCSDPASTGSRQSRAQPRHWSSLSGLYTEEKRRERDTGVDDRQIE
jgi:hypothetical protein